MIKSDEDYTYALGEEVKLQKALQAENATPTDMIYASALRSRLIGVSAEIDAYERSLKKSVGQMTFDERLGNEPLVK